MDEDGDDDGVGGGDGEWGGSSLCMRMELMMMVVVVMVNEVEAVLSECREEDDSCATLARLKMAIQYEEKKVSN